MNVIGNKIKTLREQHKMSRKELAEKLGLSQMQVYRLESGKSAISCAMIMKLCTIFNISPKIFFEDVNKYNIITLSPIPIIGELNSSGIVYYNTKSYCEVEAMPDKQLFGLQIKKYKPLSFLQENDILIIDSNKELETGDLILLCRKGVCSIYQIEKIKEGIILKHPEKFNEQEYSFIPNSQIPELKYFNIIKIIRRIR